MTGNQRGGIIPIAGTVVLLVAVAILGFSSYRNYFKAATQQKGNKVTQQSSETPILQNSPSPSASSADGLIFNNPQLVPYEEEKTSPDGKYSFSLNTAQNPSDTCTYSVTEKASGKIIKLASLGDKIPCQQGMGYTSSFLALGKNGKLAVSVESGKIAIIDISTDTYIYHTYKPELAFGAVSADFSKWLYRKESGDSISFSLKDSSNAELMEISVSSDDQNAYAFFRLLNDVENNGFVFVSRNYKPPKGGSGDSRVSYKFDFLSADDLSFKTLLVTSYKAVPGRGCSGDQLASEKGEIIIKPGCIMVSDEYVSSDNAIHIKL